MPSIVTEVELALFESETKLSSSLGAYYMFICKVLPIVRAEVMCGMSIVVVLPFSSVISVGGASACTYSVPMIPS